METSETSELLEAARRGDRRAFETLFAAHREAIRRMIELRLDPRLRPRIDASDVIQDTHMEAFRRLDDYFVRLPMPFGDWLRKTAYERLLNLRRDHVTSTRRSVRCEVALPDRSSMQLARRLVHADSSPSHVYAKTERAAHVRQALEHLPDTDREILLMRYVEGLSNQDSAMLLGIDKSAASKRHARALLRLRALLDGDDK